MKIQSIIIKAIWIFLFFTSIAEFSLGQDSVNYEFGDGLKLYSKDSRFYMKFSARFQTLYEGILNLESDTWNDKLLTRRARLKFDGYAHDPRLEYKIELSLSNRDIGGVLPQTNNTVNIVLDAVIKYKFAKNWQLWFGQTKLPGNRERVISSQKLQFVDRSLVNSRYNIDRDLGFQLHHKDKIGDAVIKEVVSISKGEGRNVTVDNIGGYDYTARVEILPFGEFTSKGDYFGSDLKREQSPKLSLAATYDYNDGAGRQRGQLGSFILDDAGVQLRNDLSTVFIDAMFKYKGFSAMTEFASKSAKNDYEFSRKYGTGTGFVFQAGYLFPNNFEIAGRFTDIKPNDIRYSSIAEETEYTLGFSRYIVDHSLKIQSDLSYTDLENADNRFRFRFQVELAF